ncbi:MAG: hypothetical protein WA885_15860, partial [Phormidesmis sp.]
SRDRANLLLETRWAVTPRDIQRAMLETKPSIVHFSGRSGEDDSLADFFQLFADRLECVLLNDDHSAVSAAAIAQHINYTIGMNNSIPTQSAIEFAVGFYDAIGAGESIEFAFSLGCHAIRLARLAGHDVPVLKCKGAIAAPSSS